MKFKLPLHGDTSGGQKKVKNKRLNYHFPSSRWQLPRTQDALLNKA